ncbi:uncharacterized protein LOC120341947 [Styela clava]|uniref:uncharacterized protein LOC120341947 n=1 Tax=Styela clava TaxID=7725 RepID=UPI001939D3E9|nr:uncharacterized protein LOC120341947 [Styela clava]
MRSYPAVTSAFVAFGSAVVWLCVVSVGVLENSGGSWAHDVRKILFRNDSHILMEKWAIDITLPKWSLCVWEFIYTWNTLWSLYCVIITCRPVSEKSEEDTTTCSVNAFPPIFHCFWAFAGISHVCWMFFWDREIIVGSVFFQAFVVIACIGCLYVSHSSVDRNGALLEANHRWDLWVCRTLVQNGITMFGTWSAVLFLINTASLLTYDGRISSYLTSIAALGALGFILIFWFILDTFILDRWVRYTFSIYPTISWASAAILLRHFRPWSHVTIITLSILCAAFFILVLRLPLVVWKCFTYPLYITQTIPQEVDLEDQRQKDNARQQVVATVL